MRTGTGGAAQDRGIPVAPGPTRDPEGGEASFFWLLAAITALGALLRCYGIGSQPAIADEIGAAISAVNYVENGQFGPTMWYHPNLRNLVLYGMGSVFGYGPYALRGASLLSGVLAVPLVGALARKLLADRRGALVAAWLMALEQVHITFSRQAIQETWTTFLFLLGVYFFLLFLEKDHPWRLLAAGAAFGLGIASKFHALPPLLVCCLAGWRVAWRERSPAKGCFFCCCLLLLPLAVFLASYLPWFAVGHGAAEWCAMQRVLLVKMTTHTGNPMDQAIDNRAWQWFLRPMGYANFIFFQGRPHLTVAFSNPLVWLAVLPATGYLAVRGAWQKKSAGIRLLLALFTVCYLPLAASPRPIWLLTSLAVLPFAFMVLGGALSAWAGSVPWRNRTLALYLAGALFGSLLLFPLAAGEGKSYGYLEVIAERFRPPFEPDPRQLPAPAGAPRALAPPRAVP